MREKPTEGPPEGKKRAYIIRDLSVKHLEDTLERLRKKPPEGWTARVAKFDEDLSRGRVFEDVVRPELEAADLVVALTDEPNANVAYELGYTRGFRDEQGRGRRFTLAISRQVVPAWVRQHPPYQGFGVPNAQDLSSLRHLLSEGQGAFYEERPEEGGDTLFLCPTTGLGEPYVELAKDLEPSWRTVKEGGWDLATLHEQLHGIRRVLWVIVPRDEDSTPRDGVQNTACAAVAGFARAVGLELHVLRADAARDVADVAAEDKLFEGLEQLERLLRVFLPGSASTPTVEAADPLDALWRSSRTRCSRLVSLFPAHAHELSQVFVDFSVARLAEEGEGALSKMALRRESLHGVRGLLALPVGVEAEKERAAVTGRWVLLGDPGSGKSTAAKHLVVELADLRSRAREGAALDAPDRELLADGEPPVALYLPLAFLAAERTPFRHPVDHAVEVVGGAEGDDAVRGLADRLRELGRTDGRLWLCFDGYDELDADQRALFRDRLVCWVDDLPAARVLVTSRRTAFESPGVDFRVASLENLTRRQQDLLLERWLGADGAIGLRARLDKYRSLGELADNPLLLSLIAKIEEDRLERAGQPDVGTGEPPGSRDELYDQAIDLLLRRGYGEHPKAVRSPRSARLILGALSLALQEDEREAWSFEELEARLWEIAPASGSPASGPSLAARIAESWTSREAFLEDVGRNAGVFGPLDGDGSWTFLHRSLREFLAGEELARRGAEACLELAKKLEDAPRWAEVFGLAVGRLGRIHEARLAPDGLAEARASLLTSLAESAPGLALRAVTEVEGLDLETSFRLLRTPRDPRDWTEILDEERHQWDGVHLARAVAGWLRDGRTTEEVRSFLLGWIGREERELEEAAHVLFALEQGGVQVEPRELFRAIGRPAAGGLPEMARIPPGAAEVSFYMGSSEDEAGEEYERPRHPVRLAAFHLAVTPVTQAEWALFDPTRVPKQPDHPVVEVSWWEAWLYCRWIGCELPTEAQWECACRAGTETPWSTGKRITKQGANVGGEETSAVRRYRPNPWGLHDMHGNVWEWCMDWFGRYELPARAGDGLREPTGGVFRVYRGGSFRDAARYARSACRLGWGQWDRADDLGFRPARGITTE